MLVCVCDRERKRENGREREREWKEERTIYTERNETEHIYLALFSLLLQKYYKIANRNCGYYTALPIKFTLLC